MLNYRLRTFLVLAKTLNYTKTAEILHMTQPAVSQHIRYLENTYDIKLFEYQNRKLQLTELGKLFYQKISDLDIHSQEIIKELKNIEKDKEIICFDATFTFGEYILPRLLCKWIKEDGAEIRMRIKRTSECLEALNEGHIDFALVEGFFDKSIYANYLVKKTHMGLICEPNHPLTKMETVKLYDILSYPLIVRQKESHMRGILPTGLAEHNLSYDNFHSLIQCGSMNVMKTLIKEGCGIGFLHEDIYKEEVKKGELKEISIIDFTLCRELNLVYLKNTKHKDLINKVYYDLLNEINKEE
ncbi:MAG: LysR family transcriptional regulator [Traorella sp.]